MNKFSINEAVMFGWDTTKANFSFLIQIILIIAAVYIISEFVRNSFNDVSGLSFIFNILFWIVHIVLDIGLIKVALKFAGNQKPSFDDLWDHYPLFWKYLAGSILTGLIVVGGLILLIIPGIIFSIRLQFVSYLIIDKNRGPIEAIKESWQITKGNGFNLFFFDIIMGVINLLGIIALLIGLLWTLPTTAIATALVYKKLAK